MSISVSPPIVVPGRVEGMRLKRYLWIFGPIAVAMPLWATALLWWQTGSWVFAWLPWLIAYGLIPFLDVLLGEDRRNPSTAMIPGLERDRWYRVLLILSVFFAWGNIFVGAWLFATQSPPWWAALGLVLSFGLANGLAINIGHELGHKSGRLERLLAMFALAVCGYGHFTVEHNAGHHAAAATAEDSASARLGESVWRFAFLREIPGAFRRAWGCESHRLAGRGYVPWGWHNRLFRAWGLSLGLWAVLAGLWGWRGAAFWLVTSLIGYLHLSFANYVEHYGLGRRRLENVRYEPVRPEHSWNADFLASNLVLFHLQRHSDHHTHARRRYQALLSYPDLPSLPGGYPTAFLLASVPTIWRRVMDPKVRNWARQGDHPVNAGLPRRD